MTYDERKLIKIDVHTTKSNLTPMESETGSKCKEFLRKKQYTKEKVKMAVNIEVQFLFNKVKPQQRRYS